MGRSIVNYHGEDDINVPIAGGFGSRGPTDIAYRSQTQARQLFERAGGSYVLHVLPEAGHALDQLDQASRQSDGLALGERVARDLGLTRSHGLAGSNRGSLRTRIP